MPKPHQAGHRQRLRARFLKNPDSLEDYELLELFLGYVLLRQDTKPLAKDLLAKFKTLRNVLDAPVTELQEISGFGPSLAAFWLIFRELKARHAEDALEYKTVLLTGGDVAEMARQRLAGVMHEELWGVYVDNQNRMLGWRKLAEGQSTNVFVHAAFVVGPALALKASGIILVHNHPGGSPQPSAADIELTKTLGHAAAIMGLRLVDHVVVTANEYSSMSESGVI